LVVKPGAALDLGKNAMSYVKGPISSGVYLFELNKHFFSLFPVRTPSRVVIVLILNANT
jgi:hypothetical protein